MNSNSCGCTPSSQSTDRCNTESGTPARTGQTSTPAYRAPANVVETPTGFQITLDAPGATRDAIDIRVHEGVLSVVAPVAPREHAGARPILREYGVGDFRREFRIGEDIDAEAITASYTAGVLTIDVPKARQQQPRRVPVTAAN